MKASFYCTCGCLAGSIEMTEEKHVIIVGPVCERTIYDLMRLVKDVDKLFQAITHIDVEALYRLNPDLVPFYCPECKTSYCRGHWYLESVLDDGWYDYTDGTCPHGHTREIDD